MVQSRGSGKKFIKEITRFINLRTKDSPLENKDCVKSVQIRSFSGPYFPIFELNTGIYSSNLRIQSEYGKIRTRKNSVFGHFSQSGLKSNLRYACSTSSKAK